MFRDRAAGPARCLRFSVPAPTDRLDARTPRYERTKRVSRRAINLVLYMAQRQTAYSYQFAGSVCSISGNGYRFWKNSLLLEIWSVYRHIYWST